MSNNKNKEKKEMTIRKALEKSVIIGILGGTALHFIAKAAKVGCGVVKTIKK